MDGNGKSMVGKCAFGLRRVGNYVRILRILTVAQALNQIVFRDETRGIRSVEDHEEARSKKTLS